MSTANPTPPLTGSTPMDTTTSMDTSTDELPPNYQPNRPATETEAGWFFGIPVPKGWFATVAGICEPWSAADKIKIKAYKELKKSEEEAWAKKNVCMPRKKICGPGYGRIPKASTSCGCR